MDFLIEWLTFYIAIMFTMSVDNIFWISTSPEYPSFKKKNIWGKLKYILKSRVYEVLKHPRDIIPAAITSFILTIIF